MSFTGTPLSVFSKLKAAGSALGLFFDTYNSASGLIPSSTVAPMIYVSQIELQKKDKRSRKTAIIPRPDMSGEDETKGFNEESIIFKAMKKEMERAMRDLKTEKSPRPFFVDYRLKRTSYLQVQSTLGDCYECSSDNIKNNGSATVLLGNKMITSAYNPFKLRKFFFTIPDEIDYDNLRYQLWQKGCEAYLEAASYLDKKRNFLKKNSFAEKEIKIPEFNEMPSKVCLYPSALTHLDKPEQLVALANELSAIFLDYPELYDTNIKITQEYSDFYRLTSEGQQILLPSTILAIHGKAMVKTVDNNSEIKSFVIPALSLNDLPSKDSLTNYIHSFAQLLIKESKAKVAEEEYVGPVLYEDAAVAKVMVLNFLEKDIHASQILALNYLDDSYKKIDQKITDTKINLSQLGNTSSYKGTKLLGYSKNDIDGIEPMTVSLIEKGILKKMLCGRNPSGGCSYSTGNESLKNYSPGILHLTSTKTMSQKKMRQQLIKDAKKAGLKYAYIIRSTREISDQLIQIDVKTNKEEIVRGYTSSPSKEELMNIPAVSNEEYIYNYYNFNKSSCRSIITPKAIVVKQIKLKIHRPSIHKIDQELFLLRH